MSLKKKLVVSTLAVSMTAASVAGLPLSTKGLAQQLGIVGVASAADSGNFASLKARANTLYSQLTASDKQTLRDFRAELQGLSQAQLEAIFAPVLAEIDLTDTDLTALFGFYTELVTSVYNPDYSAVTDIMASPNYQSYEDVLKKIGDQAGITNLSVNEVYNFVFGTNGVEQRLITLFKGKSEADLLAIAMNTNSAQAVEAKKIVLDSTIGTANYTLRAAINELGITPEMLSKANDNFQAEPSITKFKSATLVVAHAYYNAYLKASNPGDYTGPTTGTVPAPVTPEIYDVSKLVQIVAGKATLNLVDADVIKAFDALVAANAGKTGLTLTLNLGTVNADTVEIPLSKAIIEAAKAKGIANIAITFNGLTVTIPVSQFSAAVTLTVNTVNENAATTASKLKLASKVYDFKLTVDGVVTTSFKRPIQLKLPLKSVPGLDKELLSVAKIVYGDLQFQGGVVDGDYIVEPRDTFSSYAVLENKVTFTDTANVQAWAGRQIEVVAAKGAIEGIGAGKFAPKSNVTRAEFAKMLIRALNLENNSATQSFQDVSSTAWYAPYVAVAAEKGIITGRSASQFDPNATITRAEMATMISRALKSINPAATTDATAISKFSDAAKISASLKDGVAFAATHNLVIGNAGKFDPNNTATRAEAAVIIYRTMNFK